MLLNFTKSPIVCATRAKYNRRPQKSQLCLCIPVVRLNLICVSLLYLCYLYRLYNLFLPAIPRDVPGSFVDTRPYREKLVECIFCHTNAQITNLNLIKINFVKSSEPGGRSRSCIFVYFSRIS